LYIGDLTQVHSWITKDDEFPLPSEEQNCQSLVTVTGDEVTNSVKVIPRLETLVSLSVSVMLLRRTIKIITHASRLSPNFTSVYR